MRRSQAGSASVPGDGRDARAIVDAAIGRALDRSGAGQGSTLCVALSGGCDSTVLMDALARMAAVRGLDLRAVHVHHGLSPNAARWARQARDLCRRLGVRCTVSRVRVDRHGGLGVEAAARAARMAVLARQRSDWVVLGHHLDDQAETVLLQLLRGAGPRGLAAMPEIHGPRRWLRPLLGVSRADIEACARARGLSWVEDESNASEVFDRNFLRSRVLPLLYARFPGAGAAFARSARLLGEADALMQAVGAADLAQAQRADGSVSIGVLRALGDVRARTLLRAWLERVGEPMPAERRLAEAHRQALSAAGDAQVAVRLGAHVLRRWRDRVWLVPALDAAATGAGLLRPWNRQARMRVGEAGVLVARAALGDGLSLRWLREHRIEVYVRGHERGEAPRIAVGDPPRHRTLRNLWQEAGVPPWWRPGWPLLEHAGRVICVPGVAVASEARAWPGEPGRVFEWRPDVVGAVGEWRPEGSGAVGQ